LLVQADSLNLAFGLSAWQERQNEPKKIVEGGDFLSDFLKKYYPFLAEFLAYMTLI